MTPSKRGASSPACGVTGSLLSATRCLSKGNKPLVSFRRVSVRFLSGSAAAEDSCLGPSCGFLTLGSGWRL